MKVKLKVKVNVKEKKEVQRNNLNVQVYKCQQKKLDLHQIDHTDLVSVYRRG